jgi:hypothetical protein
MHVQKDKEIKIFSRLNFSIGHSFYDFFLSYNEQKLSFIILLSLNLSNIFFLRLVFF